MDDKVFDFFSEVLSRDDIDGSLGIVVTLFFVIYILKGWLSPLFEKLNSIAKKKDLRDVDKDLTDGFSKISEVQNSFHNDLSEKLETIEKMIETLENSARTNNVEIDDIRKDVDKIKILLDGYFYFKKRNE